MRMQSGGRDGGRENPDVAAGWRVEGRAGQACGGDAAVAVFPGGGSDPKYVELNSWQIEEIHKGLAEAERGEFASENEVKRVAKKWSRRAR